LAHQAQAQQQGTRAQDRQERLHQSTRTPRLLSDRDRKSTIRSTRSATPAWGRKARYQPERVAIMPPIGGPIRAPTWA
jgi:hypothetical protein